MNVRWVPPEPAGVQQKGGNASAASRRGHTPTGSPPGHDPPAERPDRAIGPAPAYEGGKPGGEQPGNSPEATGRLEKPPSPVLGGFRRVSRILAASAKEK